MLLLTVRVHDPAGSVDEEKDEQGIAHLVEHVTFLGSAKREGLLGTGARSNAYTDFHHTVFHVHAPLVNTSFGEPTPMLPQVCCNPRCDSPAESCHCRHDLTRHPVEQGWQWLTDSTSEDSMICCES